MRSLVSILIPAYDAEKFIAEAIQSAIAQTWPRKEIIVVDDGSRDGTAEVARRFASKDVVFVSKENEGAAATRNYAFQLSQGEYIQWLDADDLLAPDKVERQLAAICESNGERTLLSSPWGNFYYDRTGALCPYFPVAGSYARRMAAEENGRKSPYANGDLVDEPETCRSGGILGYPSPCRR
jgi:glycosyltransferase involved in cell wall biosynthesis